MKMRERAPEPRSENALRAACLRRKNLALARDSKTFASRWFLYFSRSLLNFTYWFPLKYQPVKGCIWVLFFPKYTAPTRLWPWPGTHILFYFIMHEVICTHLKMHLEYITSVVDLTEMYSRGFITLGWGVEWGQLLIVRENTFLGKDTKAGGWCRGLWTYKLTISPDILTSRSALPSCF